eukprot:10759383-Prorocentrum_lima.AAC.1
MTSSLVGSEMCIRDRDTVDQPMETPLTTNWQYGHLPVAHTVPQAFTPNPVSYTHLTLPTICSV